MTDDVVQNYDKNDRRYVFEYVWLDKWSNFRYKTRVGNSETPLEWNYDGSSTGQALGSNSEVTLVPRAVFPNPLINIERAMLVICDTYDSEGNPLENNHRYHAEPIFNRYQNEYPWYGFEQEYFLINRKTGLPLGFPTDVDPKPQGPYYCSVRNDGREITDAHLIACLEAGIEISGTNAEVALGQWEFQIGPCEGIKAGDHVLAARYLLEQIANKYDCDVDLSVKPIKGDWNGSGCHVNFSTEKMRTGDPETKQSGLEVIKTAIENLGRHHDQHMLIYGEGNRERLTGGHETAHWSKFTWGQADRGASVRIGGETVKAGCGYFEDRRPGSNIDPYLVSAKILASVMDRGNDLMSLTPLAKGLHTGD